MVKPQPDLLERDLAVPEDLAVPGDLSVGDMAQPDLAAPDLAEPDIAMSLSDMSRDLSAPADMAVAVDLRDGSSASADLRDGSSASGDLGPGFISPSPAFDVGDKPHQIEIGDVNEDGKLDVVTSNYLSVSILLGNNDGTLGAPTKITYIAPNLPYAIALVDLNHDNHLDLVVGFGANTGSGTVEVRLGDGKGNFNTVKGTFSTNGAGPYTMVAVDVNHDSFPDLVMAGNISDHIAVLLGKGDGTFTLPAKTAPTIALDNPSGVTVGRFDADDVLDVISSSESFGNVTVFKGQGDGGTGNFTRKTPSYPAGGTGGSPYVVSHDFNGDKILDLIVANDDGTVGVLLGQPVDMGGPGNGSFGTATTFDTAGFTDWITLGDFNLDGRMDFAVTINQNIVKVYLAGPGDMGRAGGFQFDADYTVGNFATALNAGDFNGDGKIDLAVANFDDSTVSILLNNHP
jgi:hypothetical protein